MKHWIGIIVGIAFLIGVIASIAGCKNASNQTMTSPTTVEFGGVNSTSSKSTSGLVYLFPLTRQYINQVSLSR
jgi:hypothetical protein